MQAAEETNIHSMTRVIFSVLFFFFRSAITFNPCELITPVSIHKGAGDSDILRRLTAQVGEPAAS